MKNLLDVRSYALMTMLFVAISLSAQTELPVRYVSIQNGSYANNGRSWNMAKNNLQDAIEDLRKYMAENMLKEGHVYVSAGTYTPTTATPGGDGTLYTSFILYDGIKVYGGFNPDAPEARPEDRLLEDDTAIGNSAGARWKLKYRTILSGNHTHATKDPLHWDAGRNEYTESYTGNSYHVVWFASAGLDKQTNRAAGLGEVAALDGFTIRDGYAMNRITPTVDDGRHAYHNSYGGGVYMVANSEVRNCIITQNASSLRGGGVYMDGGGLLEQCYVARNQSAGVGVTDGYGGGVAMDDGGMVRHCIIENNVGRAGGGLSLLYSQVPETDKERYATAVVGTVVNNNTSTAEAGGVYMRNGGVLNHVSIVRNKCVGVSVVYNNRRYARSGGLYVDGGAFAVNSVIWGNEVAANNNVQYATFRETSKDTKTTLAYVALSRYNYVDWSGTIKKTNGVYSMAEDNSNSAVASYYPEFTAPVATAGVYTEDYTPDWTPLFYSTLRHKGMQINDYPKADNIGHAHVTNDLMGNAFAPRCMLGALMSYSKDGEFAMVDDLEGSGKQIRTVFVEPSEGSNSSLVGQDQKLGGSWEQPFHYINDALGYINKLTGTEAPSEDSPVQLVVKEGVTTTTGNAYMSHLRATTITVPSNVRLYGGFSESLTGTDVSIRDPKNTPTRITANIIGGNYEDNGTHIIIIGHGTSHAVLDGFQLYFANTQPNEVLTSLGLQAGAGLAVLNSATSPLTGKETQAMRGNIVRNCVIANCTAPQGAAVYLSNSSGKEMQLQMENCIFHNNSVLHADSAIVAAVGDGIDLELNHCLIRGNIGYAVMAKDGARISVENTALHANIRYDGTGNIKIADLKATEDAADPRVLTFSEINGGTITTGNVTAANNVMDIGIKDFNHVARPVLRYHTTYVSEYPNFVNATNNIGVNRDGDITVYGGDTDWMPTNTNPMVNAAGDDGDGLRAYDMTGNTARDYGGAADIGALENTYQPVYGSVIYVRDYGNTTDPGGDGSSWAKAINGNSLDERYRNNHGFEGVDAELYPEGEQLTGLQWAVDHAFYRSLEKDGDKIKYNTISGVTCFEPGNLSTVDETKTSIDVSTVLPDKRVEVWVAKGEYLRREGFFMRDAVDVYGGFPDIGNPGKKERQPKTYETIIETNRSEELTAEGVIDGSDAEWGPQVYDYKTGSPSYTNSWSIVDYSSDDQEGNAINCIDGRSGTFWHSRWQDSDEGHGVKDGGLPQWVIIDLGQEETIASLKINNRKYFPTEYTIGYATVLNKQQNHTVDETLFTTATYSTTGGALQTINLTSNITCRYLYIKVTKSSKTHVDIKEIKAYRGRNGIDEVKHIANDGIYDLNGSYENAYATRRVLTQPFPYFKGTTRIDGKVSGENLEFDNKTYNPFSMETSWDGLVIQNGRVKITHQRDGGAGVALRENGRLANCVVRNNVLRVGTDARGAGVFQNGGVIENCVIEGNVLIGVDGNVYSNIFGSGLYQRTGTVFNTSIARNVLKGSGTLQGAAVFFENGRFYNNTITGNEGSYTVYSGQWFSNGRIDVYNTIICNNKTGNKEFDCTTSPANITLKNCLFDSESDHKAFDATYTGVDKTSFRYVDDVSKLFVDPDGDYRLLPTAPAINVGTEDLGLDITNTKNISLPSYDADFTNRVKDCIVDIGAYEYNGAQDIKPDTKTDGYAFYYVIPHGTGNASADSPQNAACWRKLQNVLDAAGRYAYDHKDDESRRKIVIKLAGDSKRDRTINGKTVNGYEGFTYRPSRSNKITSPGEEENQRDYSIIVPRGVEVWGGYHEEFEETKEVDGQTVTVEKRDVLEYRTSFSGIFLHDDVNVQAYNVVTFTDNTYDVDGNLLLEHGLADVKDRAVLDGIIIENGKADGELKETRMGAGAIVTGYAHVRNCIVQNNTASDMGGGLYLKPGALVSGSIIQYNATNGNGGGVYVEEEPEDILTPTRAHIYTSDIIYNTAAHAGGGIYFKTNLRANSSLFWHNTGSELANIAGETMPTDVGSEEPGIDDYPISFCATETTREPGIDNIIVNTDISKGVRFDKEGYNHDYVATDGTPVKVMHNDYEFYKVGKYSLIVRSGMAYSDYAKLVDGQDGIIVTDMAGVDRMGYDNEFIDIGARAYPGVVLPEVDDDKLMTRIFVAKSEDEVSMDAVNVMRNQTGYYSQEGSSLAYPMRYLGDALEYVRTIRKKTTSDGQYKYRDVTFEIILSGGTYYPRRNIRGEYVNSRGCTFLVPEGVTIVGGVNVQNDGEYYGNVSDVDGKTATEFSYEGNSVTIRHATLYEIISKRKLHDINHNSIAEPWEMEVQTILSGQVVNSSTSHNVYHVMTCVADEDFVGGLPTPTYDYTDKVADQTAGGGSIPKYRGQPIIIDGVNVEDGMALDYQEAAVNSKYTYFKGGAISVEGNWTTGMTFMNHDTEAQEQDYSPVGFRNIPLELRNCTFMNNGGGRGGAIYTDGELKVFACNFAQNYARVGSDTFEDGRRMSYAGRGGAINASYETIIVNSIFANNEADPNGDSKTFSGVGGAVLLSNYAKLHVLNCDFVRNLAAGYPAIFCYQTNKGITETNKGDVELLRADNPHKVINSIFWGNKSMDADMDKVINFHGYMDGANSATVYPEALWFCAYEKGKGNEPVYSKHNIDYRLQNYEGYILSPDDTDKKYTSNGTYIPYLWKDSYQALDIDNKTVIDGEGWNPDVVDGMNPVTNNIIINSDNDAIDGPNFISPSTEAGKAGFYISADWMIGRINNLVDNGWTYLQQDLSGEEPNFCYENGRIVGSGIYLSASYDYGKLSTARTAIPIGTDLYMSYSEGTGTGKPVSRVSSDPNPTHHQTFIDIGVYEYQHVKLEPFIYDEVDVLWVTEREKTGGVSDGKTWATASSDLQRAIETLLASRNGHDKEIRMLEGNYQPVYTINGSLAFTVTTDVLTGITLPDDEKHGVRSLTIRGGYSKELEGQENVENYPVCLYASERTGGDLNFDHVFIIGDMTQRLSQKNGNEIITSPEGYVVPVVLKGLNFSNTKAKSGDDSGVAVFYDAQFATSPTYWKDNDICADNTGEELYKLTMSQCSFFNNGSPEEESVPAVTIGKDYAGKALIYNSLFHSNKGNPLKAFNTKAVNCTFALNDGPAKFAGSESGLHNSILWRNNLMGEEDGDVTGLSNTGAKEMMTNNAISSLAQEDGYNNVPLSVNNNDVLRGPNFFNPMDVADGTTAFDASLVATARDFHVNPSSMVLSKGNVDRYVELVKNLNGVYPYAGADNVERVKKDRDMADVTRYYGSGLERGAYECVAIMNRVLYVNPNNAIPGNGDSWEQPYGKGQIQTAIDAAAVYHDVNDKKNAFVFVKGNGEHTGESLMMREGVSLYGSIDLTCNAEVKRESDGTYLDDKINAYIMSELPSYRKGMAMSDHTIVGGVKADADVRFCVYDGLEIGDKDDAAIITERTEPVVEFGDNSTVALVNSIISNNRVADGVNLIDNRSGLLYNILVRDNGRADVALGSDGYALNCTFAGDNDSWTNLSATPERQSINNIMYKDGGQMMPFAPYFRQSDVAYHADEVPNKDNRNLWYQLHEKAPYIGAGTNGGDSRGKSLLPELLQAYVDFAVDRDLLGNPRVLGKNIDKGCYETWSTGYYSPSSDDMVAENLFANMNSASYSGHHYPHEGSVVYLQNKGNLICELKDDRTPYFTADTPLKPGYLLAMEGGSLYGQGNEIRLPYVAAERRLTGRYALVALPFATVNDGKYMTRTSYDVATDGSVTALNEETTGYARYMYDGEARSQWNYEYDADNSTCWKTPGTNGVIEANDGYLLDRGGQEEETLRFTAFDKVSVPYKEGAEDKTVTLTQYDQSIVGKGDFHFTSEYNMGWNLKGMPYLISGYDTGKMGEDGREAMFVPHVIYTMSGEGRYMPGYSWKLNGNVTSVSPCNAFFTQTAVIGDGKTETLHFAKPSYDSSLSDEVLSRMPSLAISGEGYGTDEVIICPDGYLDTADEGNSRVADSGRQDIGAGTLDYCFGTDGVKFAALNDTLPQIYVSGNGGVGLSLLSHAPMDVEIPLIVEVKGKASYTFSLSDRGLFSAYSDVYIRDNETGAVTSLISGDYTVEISPADSPSRFSLFLGEDTDGTLNRKGNSLYNVNGMRVKRPHGNGVYIEVGDRTRKVLHVR